MDRLFPPRAAEDSGSLPSITGVSLGHFVIEERIGRGGMGAVFRAMDTRLDRVVALKVLSPQHSSDPDAVIRFQNEARAAARLDHDNIARVHFIGEEFGLHYIAFEFVTGTNIRNFIVHKGKLSPADAVNYTLQIAEALRHTAAANVVHRDIKPSNIIISPTGLAKLVDLGLARHFNPEMSHDLTVAGTALGTFDYIAPEQAIDARNVDVRSDIYSLGCSLYHMLTGEPPYPSGTMFEKVMNHHRRVPPDPCAKNPRVSPQLGRVVQKMMASNPDERYSSPDTLITDLMQIADSLGLEPTYSAAVVWTAPLFKHRTPRWDGTRTWLAVAIVLLLVVFLVERLQWDAKPVSQPSQSVASNEGADSGSQSPTNSVTPEPIADGTGAVVDNGPASTVSQPGTSETRNADASSQSSAKRVAEREQAGMLSALQLWNQTVVEPPMTTASNGETPLVSDSGTGSSQAGTSTSSGTKSPTQGKSETASGRTTGASAIASGDPFVLLVDGRSPRGYTSLASACKAAPDNAVIEVQQDGDLPVQTEGLRVSSKRLVIRAAPNVRPVLRFNLLQSGMRSFDTTTELIEVDRGTIKLFDLDLELIVDAEAISDQVMVTLRHGGGLEARGVSFTMVNPSRITASVVYLPYEESSELADLMPDRGAEERTLVKLDECICRGETDFAVQEDSGEHHYELNNVGMAISGTVFRIDGSNAYGMAMDSEEGNLVNLSLQHVTAVTGEGLLAATAGEHGSLPDFVISISDSVFRVDLNNRPFASLSGAENLEVLLGKLKIQSTRDPSFYQLTGPICVVESETALFPKPEELEPEEFGVNADNVVTMNLLSGSERSRRLPYHDIQPEQLFLRNETGFTNPAIGAASDLQNAGVDWSLPRVPLKLPLRTSDSAASSL